MSGNTVMFHMIRRGVHHQAMTLMTRLTAFRALPTLTRLRGLAFQSIR